MDDRNIDGARKAAEAILAGYVDGARKAAEKAALAGFARDGEEVVYRYEAFMQVTDSRFDAVALRAASVVIKQAKSGDREARRALHDGIAWMLREGEMPPTPILEYLLDLLAANDGPGKRGQPAHQYYLRDSAIRDAVEAVVSDYGFSRTRNEATRDSSDTPSACSIVCEVLDGLGVSMTEKNVERISDPLS